MNKYRIKFIGRRINTDDSLSEIIITLSLPDEIKPEDRPYGLYVAINQAGYQAYNITGTTKI